MVLRTAGSAPLAPVSLEALSWGQRELGLGWPPRVCCRLSASLRYCVPFGAVVGAGAGEASWVAQGPVGRQVVVPPACPRVWVPAGEANPEGKAGHPQGCGKGTG